MTVSRTKYLAAAAIALAIAAVAVFAIAPGNGSSSRGSARVATSSHSTYGHPPKGLVIAYPAPVRTVTATEKVPDRFAVEGYTVRVKLPTGSALMSVAGPAVPSWVSQEATSGQLKLDELVPATFQVSISHVSGSIPFNAAAWSIETAGGTVYPVRASPGTPSRLTAGQQGSYALKTDLPESDGVIRWAPLGDRVLVAWNWQLEFD